MENGMEKGLLGTNKVAQIGMLVYDIEKTAKDYADFLGVEKPDIRITRCWKEAQTEFAGNPSEAVAKLAFFDIGPGIQLELIEPDRNPSTWRECLDANGEGVHHIAFYIKGMKQRIDILSRNGMPLLQKGEYTGGRYAYMDARKDLKIILELLENASNNAE